jgi:hypothetical protein
VINFETKLIIGGSFINPPSDDELLDYLTISKHGEHIRLIFLSVREGDDLRVVVNENFLDESHNIKPDDKVSVDADPRLAVFEDFINTIED